MIDKSFHQRVFVALDFHGVVRCRLVVACFQDGWIRRDDYVVVRWLAARCERTGWCFRDCGRVLSWFGRSHWCSTPRV